MADALSQSKRDLVRLAQIMDIMVKFQAGKLVDKVRVEERLPIHIHKHRGQETEYKTQEERIRMMFEELGTTFVKLGQLLSTRGDIIGPSYAAELSKLQDRMRPFSSEEARHVIEEELGKPINQLFTSFESEPMASASVAQVHRAVLKNGRRVVIKVQRPKIEELIKEDLRIMHYLAKMADKYVPESRKYDPEYLVNEFERSILKELNFLRESRNALHLRENFKDVKGIYVPTVYPDMCTRRVLVMEEIRGVRLFDVIKSNSKRFNKTLIARRCTQAFLKMVMEDGFYHADLHPGNIMVLDKNVICFLDYGRMDTIDRYVADNIFRLALFAINNNPRGLVEHLVRTDMLSDGSDTEALRADVTDLLEAYYTSNVNDIELGNLLTDLVSVISKYQFNRPRELAELTRAFLLLEGVGMQLDTKFSVAEEFETYTKRMGTAKVDLKRIEGEIGSGMVDVEYMVRMLPSTISTLFKRLRDGTIRIELEHKDLLTLVRNIDLMGNRISISLILASMIVGSSFIVSKYPGIGMPIFAVSVILGAAFVLKTLLY
ncbi:MAG: AarF/ABC1/UbiB kinase family protein [Candidatus Micrarchaeota archaeon]|nr:AarF/ABC1/UbiB kinase family protein [Candidatus Micrarchaeota archaeon]